MRRWRRVSDCAVRRLYFAMISSFSGLFVFRSPILPSNWTVQELIVKPENGVHKVEKKNRRARIPKLTSAGWIFILVRMQGGVERKSFGDWMDNTINMQYDISREATRNLNGEEGGVISGENRLRTTDSKF